MASEIEETKLAAIEKRQNKAKSLGVLIVDRLLLRTNQGGIEPENKPNSRPAARGGRRGAWSETTGAGRTLGANHVSRAQKGGAPSASGDLRLGHRVPGRGGRRASIPLHVLTTLLSALGAFCLFGTPRCSDLSRQFTVHLLR